MRLDAKGYNLIELMVVVAVLGVLFAIAIPNYYALKARSQEALTVANMYNLEIAMINFSVDHQGIYPQPGDDAEILTIVSGGKYPENPFTDAGEPWIWGAPGGPPGTIGCAPGPSGYAKGFEIWGMGRSGQLPLVLRNL
ncbi:MAG: prepilin-type N-terminal cleavage/methylation domain-containing protein [Candidatus Latescibacteria bacterium]|nr:prepilin-type N-terminal cleavage/methylation domain-containing protein [Candidatus Latescibacterota bacterium]